MGLLFFISGYFSRGRWSVRARGVSSGSAACLGVPLVVFFVVLNPIAIVGAAYSIPASLSGIATPLTCKAYPQLVGLAPSGL